MKFLKPIFIVGCTNSGTKCLFHSLLSHPDLSGLKKELHFYGIQPNLDGRINRLFSLFPNFNFNYYNSNNNFSFGSGPLEPNAVRKYIKSILEHENADKDRILIKDPKLSLRLKWLNSTFPGCKVIAIVRNPFAVVEGIKRRLPLLGDIPLNLDTPTAMAQWTITNTILIKDCKDVDNFKFIRYEDMVNSPIYNKNNKSEFWKDLLNFCELDENNFSLPLDNEYSNLKNDFDKNSISNLSEWDKDFINLMGQSLLNTFGYTTKE